MGGHGGLNILPQKRWNVYNFDNREKVRIDEEAAAKEEQLKREQSRKRDTEFRLEQLRQARGLASSSKSGQSANAVSATGPNSESKSESEPEPKSKHINLFEGIRIFDPVGIEPEGDEKRKGFKRMKKEAPLPKVVLPEDEKYRLGYGVAGKGVKLPWYLEKRGEANEENGGESDEEKSGVGSKKSGKKTVEELREERLKRESREKERARALIEKGRLQVGGLKDRGYNRRGDRFN